jgi:hypothetical protein
VLYCIGNDESCIESWNESVILGHFFLENGSVIPRRREYCYFSVTYCIQLIINVCCDLLFIPLYSKEKWYFNIHFLTTFVTTFSFILTLFFALSLYCLDFRVNTYFFFVNYGCLISCPPNGCSNNTPLFKIKYVYAVL